MLHLCLRVDSLIRVHSRLRTAVASVMRPSTYYKISRILTAGQLIVVYRSPTVRESMTPTWDEALINLASLPDLGHLRMKITVYKITRRKCKEIGSFKTTAQSLIDSCTTWARISGYSRQSLQGNEAGDQEEHDTFKLCIWRPAANGSAPPNNVTGIITVVHASVKNSNDVQSRLQRFFLLSSDDDDVEGNSISKIFDINALCIIAPPFPPSLSHHAQPKFVNYIRAGMVNVDFCIAVDFTLSNSDPRVPGTLHYSM
jgi:hypothetical protein